MSSRRLSVREGQPFTLTGERPDLLRSAFAQAMARLRLRVGGLTDLGGSKFRIDNLIGTFVVGATEIDIAPKCESGDDWIRSVLSLMEDGRILPAGERAGDAGARATLLDAMAQTYADRLASVVATEGPITLVARREVSGSFLTGRLNVAKWGASASWQPHVFPSEVQELTRQNDFNATLAYVALMLSGATRDVRLRTRLVDLAAQISSGAGAVSSLPAGIEDRELPSQWASYSPAWTIAKMVLRQRLPLSERRMVEGMSLAIEPWPLLETLLDRSLKRAVSLHRDERPGLRAFKQREVRFLDPIGVGHSPAILKPDSIIAEGDRILANFEAKYRDFAVTGRPLPEECYQAITAARAVCSPVAILVYPGRVTPRSWKVLQSGPHPARLAVVGLDMFSYRRGSGDNQRANLLMSLLEVETKAETAMSQAIEENV